MITAASLAQALTPALVELSERGEDRPVLGVELVEAEHLGQVERGDMVLAVGMRSVDEVLDVVALVGDAAGLVLRRTWAGRPDVRRRCAERQLPLLTISDGAPWSSVLAMLRSALESAHAGADQGPADHVYTDLFDMADKISGLINAPITIEDATSRVLAYSTGQEDVDDARRSTIVGRRVPREVRDHFRSLGVFRRLAQCDDPFFVPAGTKGTRPRYVIPVRAGSEWLGSIWAVANDLPTPDRANEMQAAAEVVALYLLRLRAHSELHRQVHLDAARKLLRGDASETPDWLQSGPWRAAVLLGPEGLNPQARCELWLTLARRHGWRQPVVADLDGTVYTVLSESAGPGGRAWLSDLVQGESRRNPAIALRAGTAVTTIRELPRSRAESAELAGIDLDGAHRDVASVDDSWPALVLHRAVAGLGALPLVSPVGALIESGADKTLLTTLETVIDYWGEGRRAARALGVHPNTVRYRMARLAQLCSVDLDDPAQRLAVRLELARFHAGATTPG